MITPQEYIERKPKKVWMHILDLLPHVLRGDYTQTAYKNDDPNISAFNRFREEMAKHVESDNLTEIYEKTYRKSWRWSPIKSDGGDLIIENYIAREELCFEEWVKEETKKPALTILMDISIPANERNDSDMRRRHEKIYRIVAEAESQSQPCRVIAVAGIKIDEIPDDILTMYFIIKNYDDPIFSGIWGALKNNRSANDFCNVFMDYLVGTHDWGNGIPQPVYIGDDFEEDEVLIIDAKRIRRGYDPAKKGGKK